MPSDTLPKSIAIAGAWGYIGRKFLQAATTLGIETYVYDPGPAPDDLDLATVQRVGDMRTFYHLPVDFYHLALHPEDRELAVSMLSQRSGNRPGLILNEKPMAAPAHPEICQTLIESTERWQMKMLFDFPELFDGLTHRILEFLSSFDEVQIHEISLQRSKDREDPAIRRNYKRMVPIQYQESVHCLAYLLCLLAHLKGNLAEVLDAGLTVSASSERYQPPNPEAYRYPVDGRCEYSLKLGELAVQGLTDFKRRALWSKERRIVGVADGRKFAIEVDYLEGCKRLAINGVTQPCDASADSYQQVIQTAWRWHRQQSWSELMHGIAPHPRFAYAAYQLSSVLWRSAQERRAITLKSAAELLAFDARFRELNQQDA